MANALRDLGRNAEVDEQEKIALEVIVGAEEYNQACFEAIRGNTEKALELLRSSLDKGQVIKSWARDDPDFEYICNEPRFKELVSE